MTLSRHAAIVRLRQKCAKPATAQRSGAAVYRSLTPSDHPRGLSLGVRAGQGRRAYFALRGERPLYCFARWKSAANDGANTEVMPFMVIERFRDGDPAPIGERFRRDGRMLPPGVVYETSW